VTVLDGSRDAEVTLAVRFGWTLAESRGRMMSDGPRPRSVRLPAEPTDWLPLRSQRLPAAACVEAIDSLRALVQRVVPPSAESFDAELTELLAASPAAADGSRPSAAVARFFGKWDTLIQNELARRDDLIANAYLLGRGLAECYWALGADSAWTSADGADTAVSLRFLFGAARRQELTTMLGRVGPHLGTSVNAASISGSLEAWGAVAADPVWSKVPTLRDQLYDQVRRWYQLVVLGQDATTLLRPDARLTGVRNAPRVLRAYWPQLVIAVLAAGLITAFFGLTRGSAPPWLTSLLATSGVSAFAVAGVAARVKSGAQQLSVRLRQDVYTDLVAIDVSVVPPYPRGDHAAGLRYAKQRVQKAVRGRLLTPPTPPPDPPAAHPSPD
jgi:hypothetical protein